MPIERKEVEAALEKKGFQKSTRKGRDHRFYFYYRPNGDKTPINTKVSTGSNYKTLGDDLVGRMASQCKLTKEQFVQLVTCTMSGESYDGIQFPKDPKPRK